MARKFVSKGLEPTPEVDIVERLTPSMASGRKRRVGGTGLTFVGTLVNPKTLRPYMVFRAHTVAGVITIPTSGDHVVILGHGYLETEEGEYHAPAEAFGLPRVHTPGGVADKGGGMGTVLDVLVELDLREATDPVALRYFYGLAERRGASYAQLTRMRNRAEAAKSYYQTLEFPDPEEASEEMFETMGKKGVRVMNPIRSRLRNPVDAKEDAAYQAAARRLFPKLSKILPEELFAARHHEVRLRWVLREQLRALLVQVCRVERRRHHLAEDLGRAHSPRSLSSARPCSLMPRIQTLRW